MGEGGVAACDQVGEGEEEAVGPCGDGLAGGAEDGGEVWDLALGLGECRAAVLEEVGDGEAEALGAVFEALAGLTEEVGEVGEAAFGAPQGEAALLGHAVEGACEAGGFLGDGGDEFGAGGDGEFGGGGGSGGTAVGGEVDEGVVGFVADGGDEGDAAEGGGADDGLVVEGHEVLEAAAAASDDEDVGAGDGSGGGDGVEAGDGGGDFLGGAFALDGDGPDEDGAREAAGDGGADVVQDGPGGGGDDADGDGEERDVTLAGGVEEAFLGQAGAKHLDAGEKGADACVFHAFDDELVGAAVAVGGDAAGGDDLEAVLGDEAELADAVFPDDAGDFSALVFEGKIHVAGGVALVVGDLAADADSGEGALEGAFHGAGDFGDRVFRDVGCCWGGGVHGGRVC